MIWDNCKVQYALQLFILSSNYTWIMIYRVFFLLVMTCGSVAAQDLQNLSKWEVKVSKLPGGAKDEAELVFSASINKNWKLYSSDFKGDIGPLPTEFIFAGTDAYQLVGEIRPVKPLKAVDPTWDKAYSYFVDKAEFRQTIKVVQKGFRISGTIKGLLCSNADGLCVPFKEPFEVQ